MTKHTQEERVKRNPLLTMLTVLAIGSGAIIAGAVALSSRSRRKQIKQALWETKDNASAQMKQLRRNAKDKKDQIADNIENKISEVKSDYKEALQTS